jgi:xanthine dehydrogenase YagS FAD-binding subunit
VLGWSEQCVATHPSDMAVGLAALDATVHTSRRAVPFLELHRLPGDEPWRDTILEPGELITALELPAPPPGRQHYRKVRDRASFAFALVSVAAVLSVEDGSVADVRLALGGVAHKPWRAEAAEGLLRGGPASEEAFRSAAEAELQAARPLRDNGYKLPLARNAIVRTLLELA